jgi:hypothetical protein
MKKYLLFGFGFILSTLTACSSSQQVYFKGHEPSHPVVEAVQLNRSLTIPISYKDEKGKNVRGTVTVPAGTTIKP